MTNDTNDGEDDFMPYLGLATLSVAGIGSMVPALHVLGHPVVALWAWRIGGALSLVLALFAGAKVGSGSLTRAAAVLNVVVGLVMVGASLVARQAFAAALPAVALPSTTIITIEGIRLWHGVALSTLALGTVTFLVLFIRMVERGVSPQVESHWGGIGGGMGGWRMSASLTYLAAAAVFGVLFAIFVFQLEVNPRSQTPTGGQPPVGATSAPKPPASNGS